MKQALLAKQKSEFGSRKSESGENVEDKTNYLINQRGKIGCGISNDISLARVIGKLNKEFASPWGNGISLLIFFEEE